MRTILWDSDLEECPVEYPFEEADYLIVTEHRLWDGIVLTAETISCKTFPHLATIKRDCDRAVFYVENGCLFAKQYHHDGVNSEVYTRIKEGAPDEIYDNPEEMRAEELIKWTEKFGEELLK